MLNNNNCMSSNLLMSVLCLNVCRLCVPNIMNLGICFIKKIHLVKSWRVSLIQRQNSRYFGVQLKNEHLIKKSTRKLKHANSFLESFKYFYQMSSKSIPIILRYTVPNFARFFLRHSVQLYRLAKVVSTLSANKPPNIRGQ